MLSSLRKLFNNFSPVPAISTLGAVMYGRYLAAALMSLPSILKSRQIRQVDRRMGGYAMTFYRNGRSFIYDCKFADQSTDADRFENYAFGIAREIYVRDCYFKYLPDGALESARTVVDIGANRGAFSSMMTTVAKRIVAVEAFPEMAAIIRHNLEMNQFEDFAVEVSFLGEGGEQFDPSFPRISMEDLFNRHRLERIDLMKMDIEGSEFSVFENSGWLRHVSMLTMEVHPRCGDPSKIVACLDDCGFQVRAADENLAPLADARHANFIYAWRDPV